MPWARFSEMEKGKELERELRGRDGIVGRQGDDVRG
jgi:hypothetical protein